MAQLAAVPNQTLDREKFVAHSFPPYKLALLAELIPYAQNARTHSAAQGAQIAASIREFG